MRTLAILCLVVLGGGCLTTEAAPEHWLSTFERNQLSEVFYCEGATFGDLNGDGINDLVSGPFWYAGPEFTEVHEIYQVEPCDPERYSKNFFAFVHELSGDGLNDVLVIGFPGQDASWYENPGVGGGHWARHTVLDEVSNESPDFADLTGDGLPEIICQTGNRLGWAGPDWDDPARPWEFHAISSMDVGGRFTHGLGLGDVNGDGRRDLLMSQGWWEQPAELVDGLGGDAQWSFHAFPFSRRRGGAQMFCYDIDGDGDGDVVTGLDAHGWGLSWFEQVPGAAGSDFREHRLMDSRPEDSDFGVSFSQLHALCLVDMNSDGLLDIVTGKRHWAHGSQGDPDPTAPAVVYWFELVREADGARFVPHLVDDDSGVGVQVVAGDVDGDGAPDVVIGNKKGTFLLRQVRSPASTEAWAAERSPVEASTRFAAGVLPRGAGGAPLNLDFETGDLTDWTLEGDAFLDQPIAGDAVERRLGTVVSHHAGNYWIGGYELLRDEPVGTLTSQPFEIIHPWASFLIAGGRDRSTRLELVRAADGRVIYQCPGPNHETLQRMAVDLGDYAGVFVFIRLVDEQPGGWGHINFDDFLFHASEPDIVQERELPRVVPFLTEQLGGLAPAAAAGAMEVPAGFVVELIAGEPELHQPIAFTLDEKGRIWVAEAHSYPERRAAGEGLDKVLVFEDTNGDGDFDGRTLFAEGLNLVSGLTVGFGGVWIGAAPELLFIPDRDGDLVPDGEAEVLLDGWGYEDTHETLNSFTWGPDGWLYGCHGVYTHSRVGVPGTADEDRIPINAGIWRFHPTQYTFEVFLHGTSNPWGLDFDQYGEAFFTACVIPHLFHGIQGGRYQRQGGNHFNPYTFADIETIADHRHYAGAVNEHAWWGRNDPVDHSDTDAAGGGHAHCGAIIYQGGAFPEEYEGSLLMNNVHGNRVNRDVLAPQGSGFVGSHAPDFLLANDQWFRGIHLESGPAGSVYLSDWYDEQACHRGDREIWDRSNGRLYRISHGTHQPVSVDLTQLSEAELAGIQDHPNAWYGRQARRLLQERGASAQTATRLVNQLRSDAPLASRLSSLWALHVSAGVPEELTLELLEDGEPYLRGWAVRLALENREASPVLLSSLADLARRDDSPLVRRFLASGLQRLPLEDRWEIAAGLLSHGQDADDGNIPLLIWYGIEPLVSADTARSLTMVGHGQLEEVERFVYRRAASGTDELHTLVEFMGHYDALGGSPLLLERMVDELDLALETRPGLEPPPAWQRVATTLLGHADPDRRLKAERIALAFGDSTVAPQFRALLLNGEMDLDRRRAALDGLLHVRDPDLAPALLALLDNDDLRLAALRGLANYDSADTRTALIARLAPDAAHGGASLNADEEKAAVFALAARPPSALAFLESVRAGVLSKEALDSAPLRQQLGFLGDPAVDALLLELWGRSRPTGSDAEAQLTHYLELAADTSRPPADSARGRALFDASCAACHTLFGVGGDLGPDLTGSNRADLDYTLRNILDPSAEVSREYLATVARTVDGRLISGLARERNAESIVIATQTERIVVPLDEVERDSAGELLIVVQDVSFMPTGQLDGLSEAQVRDLLAYLASPVQVDVALPILFNGVDLSDWNANPEVWSVEDGEIVGRTSTGLAHNDFAFNTSELGDFHLTLEVKLVNNAGNSGIQFRSQRLDNGAARGYQADIGPGWWGALYEEHGRDLLAPAPEPAFLNSGDWNSYEIIAAGERIQTFINGQPCVDISDPDGARHGRIALQVHSGGPTEVRFRNLCLR
ncbi:MAG TPA: PVC-type heme-binding CxxCH protein [Planctomycetota bacterium]|nr:PVC-type heme-binding CxxCH protein [Planctomycetota bacterium]